MGQELRRHPRYPVAFRAELELPGGLVPATTVGVSRSGMSVRLDPQPPLGSGMGVALHLPSGQVIHGHGEVKSQLSDSVCGLSLAFGPQDQAAWDAFLEEEETTGGLWRMIGRFVRSPDSPDAPRSITQQVPSRAFLRSVALDDAYAPGCTLDADQNQAVLRFHTVGENGEAYRIAFEKQPSTLGEDCDLCGLFPGFREQARRAVARVLKEDVFIKMDDAAPSMKVRLCELQRGGYAYAQGGPKGPVGLVSLAVGELILVSMNGQPVFPHFTDEDLERIACDTFRTDMGRPIWNAPSTPPPAPAPPVVAAPPVTPPPPAPRSPSPPPAPPPPTPAPQARVAAPVLPAKYREGLDAVIFAQAASEHVETRQYAGREIHFHPDIWARVQEEGGAEVMGPTFQDRDRVCVLALVGQGTPRVVKLHKDSRVSLLKPPAGKAP